MSFSILSKSRNDFVSLDCIFDDTKCWHGCQNKIKAAESDLVKSSILADKLSLDKLVHFKDEKGIVHALCWIQALNGRKSCLECESEFVNFKNKISQETSEPSWKSFFTCKKMGMVALAVFALLMLTTVKSANLGDLSLDKSSTTAKSANLGDLILGQMYNFETSEETYMWQKKCSKNFLYTVCHKTESDVTYLREEDCSENLLCTDCHKIESAEVGLSEERSLQFHPFSNYKFFY